MCGAFAAVIRSESLGNVTEVVFFQLSMKFNFILFSFSGSYFIVVYF